MKPGSLAIIGLGAEGWESLTPAARTLIAAAETIVGGARHLALMPEGPAERVEWSGLDETVAAIQARAGKRVVVLASGDPMWFGFGATLCRRLGDRPIEVVPVAGAFSLAAARLGWPLQDALCLTAHGRPLEAVMRHLAPGARLLVLGDDEHTPNRLAALLAERGYGNSRIVVLSHLGAANEARIEGGARDWSAPGQGFDTIAIEARLDPGARPLAGVPGLPDDAFQHDGQLTKREIRAATLAALCPLPGQLLWDVGAGCGSIAVEWMRAANGARATAFEKNSTRANLIARNALTLGVPGLETVIGEVPMALKARPERPDAAFLGGAASVPGVIEAAWAALSAGGRLVANAVTIEAEARLLAWRAEKGGQLVRLAVSRLEPVGGFHAWKPLAPVTQYVGEKRD
ncbi:MAG: precorrin-6y C5,15-methyltransferase (decarboxylating) subunit CbiE [Rhodospirillales bacterium]|nr:precorrin-6y C5,15-methyltransferase (decarboxylating) subunit CbiE [Rhodospirillales bacterium]